MKKTLLLFFILHSFISNGQSDFYFRNKEIMDSIRALPLKSISYARNDSVFGAIINSPGDTTFVLRYMLPDWTRLSGKPSSFPTSAHSHAQSDITNLSADLSGKQATLVSGTNIKTINNTTLLGSGNIDISSVSGNAGTATTLATARKINGIDFNGSTDITIPLSYAISVQALTSSPTDAQTVYFGMIPRAPTTTAATSKIYLRQAGTITVAEIYCYSGTAGTNESWSLYIRKNNTTDYLVATVAAATSERIFSNSSLSITMAAGDYFEIKGVQPTWVTNPLTTIYGGYIKIN